jgi:lipopolysaccharide transport system ATP-binding protein
VAFAIRFDDVSKTYRGGRGYRSLRDDLGAGLGGVFRRGKRPPRGVVRALDKVSFEIPEGQSFAFIGSNGAGKTTALKLATRIAYPTSGRLQVRGRVGALLEVGTGMHPELTGRENVQLYGRILGLSGADISRRFDRIVDFAAIGAAIDQPVKQFSSGMQLRLGFSVAAHLEPDVLLVDEAIAVGDAGFQYRCMERMAALVREGRTLVFVSHDLAAVEKLCQRAILVDKGRIADDGPAREVAQAYLRSVHAARLEGAEVDGAAAGDVLDIVNTTIHDRTGEEVTDIVSTEGLSVRLHFRAHCRVSRPAFSVGLSDSRVGCFTIASMVYDGGEPESIEGDGYVECRFPNLPLRPKVYEIWGSVVALESFGVIVNWQRLRLFRVSGEVDGEAEVMGSLPEMPPVVVSHVWDISRASNS